MKAFRKIASLLMALIMVLSFAPIRAFAQDSGESGSALKWEVVENNSQRLTDKLKTANDQSAGNTAEPLTGSVRVSIVLDAPSTLEKGYSASNVAFDPAAVNYRESLKKVQDDMARTISRDVLGGKALDVVWNLTLAANIISANVPAEKIAEIRDIQGVKKVVIENQYEPMAADASDDPNMSVATGMTNAQYAWAAGYTGAGSRVAIVDTGLDYLHQSFSPVAFEVAIMQLRAQGKEVDLLTEQDVSRVWSSLNASQRTNGTASDAYFNAKVPFGFSYVDKGFDIEHINDTQGEHGSHVASIAAANRFIYKESEDGSITFKNAITEVRTQGNAPDAQLLVMKVFGKGGGAYDSDYFSAIEDAIILGADSVNLSLGSAAKGFTYDSTYQDIIDGLTGVNIIWCNSAGNNGGWADETNLGYLYSDAGNFATGGSPATYSSTVSVASVDNDGFTGAYLEFGDRLIFYTETSGYGNPAMTTIAGDYEFVYIDGPGVDDNEHVGRTGDQFKALGSSVVRGKIAICNRGTSSFFAKANAAAAQGAVAVLIANNQPGTINMNLTDYNGRVPVVSITRADGDFLMAGGESHEFASGSESFNYYTGSITVGDQTGTTNYHSEYYTMSSFSSFGVPETLDLKPEITTPGGDIYAVNGLARGSSGVTGGHDQYENMSGTSMASPQLAGIVGTLAQYYRESSLGEKTQSMGLSQRQVLQSLLMSTATPLIEADSGNFYSVMKQGSGLANLEAAINSRTLVFMNGTEVGGEVRKDISDDAADGKVKAELGDDPQRTGNYSVEFTLNNLTNDTLYYDLDAKYMTQDIFAYYVLDENGENRLDADGNPVIATYLDTWTVPLSADITWYIDGVEFVPAPVVVPHDVNMDGVLDERDADAILEYIAGEPNDHVFDLEAADFDGDEKITSYDAYLTLAAAREGYEAPQAVPQAEVPANGSVTVKVVAQIDELADYDDHGTYVEGYIFATEKDSADGAKGVVHSIPVMGYYGSWSEPSMIDVGSRLEYEYGLEARYPYMTNPLGIDALKTQYFSGTHPTLGVSYVLGGNPVSEEERYKPERNAVNAETILEGANYSQIRNSVGYSYAVENEDGETVNVKRVASETYSAYYHQNQAKWMNTSTSTGYGFRLSNGNVEEGEKLELKFTLAPEYYYDKETGTIDWENIYETWSLPFVIDNTAPELISVFGTRLADDSILVTVSAKDNEYISGFFVYDEDGSPVYEQGAREDDKLEGAPDRQSYVITADGSKVSDHLEIEVWDYAANVTTVRLNLNQDELDDPISVSLDASSIVSIVGNTVKLKAVVYPWGYEDQRVTWSSSDEEIATVDSNGLVTGVGDGTAFIRATSVADPTKYAECEVTFKYIERDLKGIVWDERGQVWFSQFNTASLPEYTKLTQESMNLPVASTAYGIDGKLYAATFDSEEMLSSLYTIDEQTFETTEIGESSIGYMDIAPANKLGRNMLLGVYGPYVVMINTLTGDYDGYFDFTEYTGGAELVGIAYEEPYRSSYGWSDWYFLLDVNGNIYNAGFLPYNGSYANFVPTEMGNLGYRADVPFFQSLYFDGTDLYWSNYVEADNRVGLVFVNDLYNDGEIFNLGYFEDSVWPVGGLYNDAEKTLIGLSGAGGSEKAEAVLEENSVFGTVVPKYSFTDAADGSLDAVNGNAPAATITRDEIMGFSAELSEDGTTYDVEVKVEAKEDLNNGYYEVSYDPSLVTLVGCSTTLDHFASSSSDSGVFKFAFADLEGVTEGDTVFVLRFTANGERDTTITVTTCETNDDFVQTSEEYLIEAVVKDVRVVGYPDVMNQVYSVSGHDVTVRFDIPCKVGYLDGNSYVTIAAEALDDGSYCFRVPDDVEEVVLVVKGDVNLDGALTNLDATIAKAASLDKYQINSIQRFAADVNGDGSFSNNDVTLIKAATLSLRDLDW